MTIHKVETTITTSNGNGSANTLNIIGGISYQIFISAATSNTSFQARITDSASRRVRDYDYTLDAINDESPLIMQGIYTLQILNSSADQNFTVLMMIRE